MDYHCAGGCGARVCHLGDWCAHCWPDDVDETTEEKGKFDAANKFAV